MVIPQVSEDVEFHAVDTLVPVIDDVELTPEYRTLATLGGVPAFAEPLHVGRPNIGDREQLQKRIDGILDRRWLTNNGPMVCEFEQRLVDFLGVKHCITTCNGTTALMLAIRGLDMQGEVIVPSFTFVATAHALQWQETRPVFCDIDPATHNLDPHQVERHITPRTTGIVGVHLWGRPCDIEALEEIARRRKLSLLFDSSHAFGCSHAGRSIGHFGNAEVFSFHATKFINAFEGGAVVTDNDELAQKLRFMRNFGFSGYDMVEHLGMNAKMPEICAAMGLTCLENLDYFVAVNRRNYHAYRSQLADLPGLRVMEYDERERRNYQYVIAEVDPDTCPLSRDELLQVLHAERILARRYFYPGCHRMEPYRSFYPLAGLTLTQTERISDRVLALPTGTAISHRDIELVASVIRSAIRDAAQVKQAIRMLPATV